MSDNKFGAKTALIAFGISAILTACSSVVPIKDVTADQAGYLSKNFSPQQLSPSIAKKLPSDGKSVGFGKLIITSEVTSEQSDGKKESWKAVATLVDAGNGLVQRMVEVSSNDIPYALLYSLTYKGIVDLKWQQVPLRGSVTSMLYEIKDATRFDVIPSTIDKEFVVDYTSGISQQIANFSSHQKACKTSRIMPASELHKKLLGQAIEIECQMRSNGAVQNRTKLVLLQEYGVAFAVEDISSSKKTTSRVLEVNG